MLYRIIMINIILLLVSVHLLSAAQCKNAWNPSTGYNVQGEIVSSSSMNFELCSWWSIDQNPLGTNISHTSCSGGIVWKNLGECSGDAGDSGYFNMDFPNGIDYSPNSSEVTSSSSIEVTLSSSSVSTSSSSAIVNSSAYYEINRATTKRCDIESISNNGRLKCLDPSLIEGKVYQVPGNVTKIDKNGLSICEIVEDKSRPTALFFILDQSGSMATNDASRIAADAIDAAMNHLQILDHKSHAGFVGFSSLGSGFGSGQTEGMIDSTYVQISALSDENSLVLIDRTNANYGGGTYPGGAIAQANLNLAQSKYDGFNKAIVFLGDGAFSETTGLTYPDPMEAASLGVPIHSIFLNTSTSADGSDTEDISINSQGSFTRLTQADLILGVMENIINNLIEIQSPTGISLKNIDLNTESFSDINNLTQQSDNSWKLPLEKDIPLRQGMNQISLITEYTSNDGMIRSVATNFHIELTSQFENENINLNGGVFASNCELWKTLEVTDIQTGEILKMVDKVTKKMAINLKIPEENTTENTARVQVVSLLALDTLWLDLDLMGTIDFQKDFYNTVDIAWDQPAENNSTLELEMNDSIVVMWEHAVDKRDNASTSLIAFNGLANLDSTIFYDKNQNGKLDKIILKFADDVDPVSLGFTTYHFTWWDKSKKEKVIQINPEQLTISKNDPTRVFIVLDESNTGIMTSTIDGKGLFSLETDLPEHYLASDTSYQVNITDSMPPIIYRAIILSNKPRNDESQLRLYYSEVLKNPQFENDIKFNFKSDKIFEYTQSQNVVQESSFSTILTYNNSFFFSILDSVKLRASAQDQNAISAGFESPYVSILVNTRMRLVVKDFNSLNLEELYHKPNFELEYYDVDEDLYEHVNSKESVAFGFGPISISKLDSNKSAEKINFNWSFSIYDHLGQFVASQTTKVNCVDEMFQESPSGTCKDHPGLQVSYTWNGRTNTHRIVGSGVYIVKLNIESKDTEFINVGIHRRD